MEGLASLKAPFQATPFLSSTPTTWNLPSQVNFHKRSSFSSFSVRAQVNFSFKFLIFLQHSIVSCYGLIWVAVYFFDCGSWGLLIVEIDVGEVEFVFNWSV